MSLYLMSLWQAWVWGGRQHFGAHWHAWNLPGRSCNRWLVLDAVLIAFSRLRCLTSHLGVMMMMSLPVYPCSYAFPYFLDKGVNVI